MKKIFIIRFAIFYKYKSNFSSNNFFQFKVLKRGFVPLKAAGATLIKGKSARKCHLRIHEPRKIRRQSKVAGPNKKKRTLDPNLHMTRKGAGPQVPGSQQAPPPSFVRIRIKTPSRPHQPLEHCPHRADEPKNATCKGA